MVVAFRRGYIENEQLLRFILLCDITLSFHITLSFSQMHIQ